MAIKILFSAQLPLKLTKRKKWVVASCPILDVRSQGETEEKAKKNLIEALSLFFISCFERGTLDSVLKKCGFKPSREKITPKPGKRRKSKNYIDVPIPFLVKQGSHQSGCHA